MKKIKFLLLLTLEHILQKISMARLMIVAQLLESCIEELFDKID